MTIVFIIDQMVRAGTQLQLAKLAGGLAATGHEVEVALLEHPAGEPLPVLDGVRFSRFEMGSLSRPGALPETLRLAAWLRRRRAQVVHTFLFKANLAGSLAAKLAGIPVIITSRRSMGYDMNWRRRALQGFANLWTDVVVGNATAVIDNARRQEPGPAPDGVVIPNGVVLPARLRNVVQPDAARVGILGNVRPVKGHDLALDAFARVRSAIPQATLSCMGDREGSPDWVATCDRQVDRLGLGSAVTWVDPDTNLEDFFDSIDLLVMPSRSEGLSNAILEAMAFGCPVLATDVGGNAEALGQAGILVPSDDPEAMAAALIDLLSRPEQVLSLGARARARAATTFSTEAMVERHVHIYASYLGSRARAMGAKGHEPVGQVAS